MQGRGASGGMHDECTDDRQSAGEDRSAVSAGANTTINVARFIMFRLVAIALAATLLPNLATDTLSGPSSSLARTDSSLAGTYLISACKDKNKYSLRDTVANGIIARLVLATEVMKLDSLPLPARRELESSYIWLAREGPPNACNRSPGSGEDYEVGLSHWTSAAPSRALVALDRSPDSGWDLDITVHGDSVEGTARSWSVSSPGRHDTTYRLTGRRLGPPNISLCVRAVSESH